MAGQRTTPHTSLRELSREQGILRIDEADVAFTIERSARRKRTISFSVQQQGNLRILAPARASLISIHRLLDQRAGWIRQKINEISLRAHINADQEFTNGAIIPYLGEEHRLVITHDGKEKTGCLQENGCLTINIPAPPACPNALAREIRLEIFSWFRRQAMRVIRERLDYWAAHMDVRYKRLVITSPRRLWGSCSAANIIRINWRIMLAPPPLLDYLVAHELCHIVHKNHSKHFWGFLERHMPDHKERRAALRLIEGRLLGCWH